MVKYICPLVFSFFVGGTLTSQDFDNYQPLVCEGELPEALTLSASQKVEEGIKTDVNSTEKRSVRETKSDFILKSNFMLDELLTGGSILFGDDVTKYVNKVADKVLEGEPQLRDELQFFVVRSNLTNAFATHQGMIFVTLGLISQLENEAQLAYVLSHEVTHYKRKHVINSVLEADKTFSKRGQGKHVSFDDNIIKLSNYSKKLELEADSSGFYMLKNAGYDLSASLDVFNVLQFSHLPFDEKEFDFSLFENEDYSIPSEYRLEEVVPINFEVDEDDEKSTHPNLNTRRKHVEELIDGEFGGEKYVIDNKEKFKVIRDICRYETIRGNLRNGDYVEAFYNVQVLKEKYKNSKFLNNCEFKALYGIAMYKINREYSDLVYDYDDYEGSISIAYYFFENLPKKEAFLFALKSGWNLKESGEDVQGLTDKRINSLLEYAIREEVFTYKEMNAGIKKVSSKATKVAVDSKVEEDGEESKYDKLKKVQQENKNVEESYYSILMDIDNLKGLDKYVKNIDENFEEQERIKVSDLSKKEYKEYKKTLNYIGAKKLVVIDPDYQNIDERKGAKLENSEMSKYEFYDQIKMVSEKSGLRTELLAPKILYKEDNQGYNDVSAMNYWLGEVFMHEEFNRHWDFVPSEADYLSHFQDEYNTNYFAYTGVINFKAKKDYVGATIALGIFVPYYLPFAIARAVTPERYAYYYTMVYDIESGERVVQSLYELDYKANKSIINSMMYDLFIQMKKEK